MQYLLSIFIKSKHSIVSLNILGPNRRTYIITFGSGSHNSKQSPVIAFFSDIIFGATHFNLLLLVKSNKFMKREAWADFIPHHHKIFWVILHELFTIFKKDSCFVLWDVIIYKFDGFERKLCQKIINEMREFFLIVFANKEDMLNLLDLWQAFDVMVNNWVTSNGEEGSWYWHR